MPNKIFRMISPLSLRREPVPRPREAGGEVNIWPLKNYRPEWERMRRSEQMVFEWRHSATSSFVPPNKRPLRQFFSSLDFFFGSFLLCQDKRNEHFGPVPVPIISFGSRGAEQKKTSCRPPVSGIIPHSSYLICHIERNVAAQFLIE